MQAWPRRLSGARRQPAGDPPDRWRPGDLLPLWRGSRPRVDQVQVAALDRRSRPRRRVRPSGRASAGVRARSARPHAGPARSRRRGSPPASRPGLVGDRLGFVRRTGAARRPRRAGSAAPDSGLGLRAAQVVDDARTAPSSEMSARRARSAAARLLLRAAPELARRRPRPARAGARRHAHGEEDERAGAARRRHG